MKYLFGIFAAVLIQISHGHQTSSPPFASQGNWMMDEPKFMVEYKKINVLEDSYEEVESQCKTVDEVVYPRFMENLKKDVVKVLNNEKYQQKLVTSKCLNVNKKCSEQVHHYSQRPICRQIYSRIILKTLDANNEVANDDFEFPSHCVCELVTLRKLEV